MVHGVRISVNKATLPITAQIVMALRGKEEIDLNINVRIFREDLLDKINTAMEKLPKHDIDLTKCKSAFQHLEKNLKLASLKALQTVNTMLNKHLVGKDRPHPRYCHSEASFFFDFLVRVRYAAF